MATVTRKPREVKPVHGVCSLTLTINGTAYKVKPIRCECDANRCYELKKADGTIYHLARHSTYLSCTCASYVWDHMDNRDGLCKHLKAASAFGLLDNPAAPPVVEIERPAQPWDGDFPRLRRGVERGPQPRRDDGRRQAQYPSEMTDDPGLNTDIGGHPA